MSQVEIIKELNSNITKFASDLAEQAINNSIKRAEDSIGSILDKANKRFDEIFSKLPVQHIKINEEETKKVTQKVNKNLERMIINAKLGLYTMLVGPAGCGKTTAAFQLSEALSLQFASVCLTQGASETWLFGRQTPNGFVEGGFSKLYREGGVFLADEIDAADANLLLSINTALSHNEMFNPMSGDTIKKHKDFIFIAAANTNGKGASHLYTGRSRLDAATLDRFIVIPVDYDVELEKEVCGEPELYGMLQRIRDQLLKNGYDEFVSTRAFVACSKQVRAGVPVSAVIKSLVHTWSEPAKNIVRDIYREAHEESKRRAGSIPNTPGKKPNTPGKKPKAYDIFSDLKNGKSASEVNWGESL